MIEVLYSICRLITKYCKIMCQPTRINQIRFQVRQRFDWQGGQVIPPDPESPWLGKFNLIFLP